MVSESDSMTHESKSLSIIAEVGVNHNGSIERACEYVAAVSETGASICKFQYFDAKALVTKSAPAADYQKKNTGNQVSQYDLLESLELNQSEMLTLIQECRNKGVEFLATAFDPTKLEWLLGQGQRYVKLGSGDMNNPDLLSVAASSGLPSIVSTGMATMEEVDRSVEYMLAKGMALDQLTLLHCTTSYPAAPETLNLGTITKMEQRYGCRVGFSDHSVGAWAAIAAVSLGAVVVEKHVTFDRLEKGPDHLASMEISEFSSMVGDLHQLSLALGVKTTTISEKEAANLIAARRSIVAAAPIKKDQVFRESDFNFKRPGGGLNPLDRDLMIGKRALRSYRIDEQIHNDEAS